MDCLTQSNDLISFTSVLSKTVRKRTDRARLPPIATFSHKLLETRTFNRRLTTHGRTHQLKHAQNQFFCEHSDCMYARNKIPFKFKCRLDRHALSHQTLGRFKCSHCEHLFNTKESLERHVLTHRNVKPYKCETCNKSFSRTSERSRCHKYHQLVSHLKDTSLSTIPNEPMSALAKETAINQSKPRPYRCTLCPGGKAFTDRGSLRRHQRGHHRGPLGLTVTEQNQELGRSLDTSAKSPNPNPPIPPVADDSLPDTAFHQQRPIPPTCCMLSDQLHPDLSLLEPSSFNNSTTTTNFLLTASPEPEVNVWPGAPFDASFSERELGPTDELEAFATFPAADHLGFQQPTSPVNLCNTALCSQNAPYRDVMEQPQLGIMHNPHVGFALHSHSASESPSRLHTDSQCESGFRIPHTSQFAVFPSSSDDAIDLSGQSALTMSNPIDLSASQPACEFDFSLSVAEDQPPGAPGRSLFPLTTWDPDPGFSFTDLLTNPELEETAPGPSFSGCLLDQASPVNYSPSKIWCNVPPPPLDLRLTHPPYM